MVLKPWLLIAHRRIWDQTRLQWEGRHGEPHADCKLMIKLFISSQNIFHHACFINIYRLQTLIDEKTSFLRRRRKSQRSRWTWRRSTCQWIWCKIKQKMSHRSTLVCFAMKIYLLIYVSDDAVPRMYAALSSWFIFHGKPYFSDATIGRW